MVKLIAIDMDGTLLNEKKELTQENKDAIKEAVDKGVKVVICTGRPCEGIESTLSQLHQDKENQYVISFNGTLIKNVTDGTSIRVGGLKGSDLHYLHNLSKEHGVNIHAFSETQGLITPKASKYTDVEANINGISYKIADFNEVSEDEDIVKIMLIDEPEVLQKAVDNLPEEVYEKYSVVRSTPYFLEFLDKKVDKGVAVKILAEHCDIERSRVMCIGDAGNDYAMIKYAGVGVAMGNAFDEIKEIADFITESNENSGVAVAIRKFI
ncbi:MAG: sugar-phosphatase [Clostridium sp.]|uniref:sugar-phosphatase n=1 Tax=Clostridium sp. TaxID=1506 RepID=UPI00304A78DD